MKDHLIGFIESLDDGSTIRKVVGFVLLLLQVILVLGAAVLAATTLAGAFAAGTGFFLTAFLAAAIIGLTTWLAVVVLGYRKNRIHQMENTGFVILPVLAHLSRGIGECLLLAWTALVGLWSATSVLTVASAGGGAGAFLLGLGGAALVFPIGLAIGAVLGFLSLFFWYMVAELFTMFTAIVENTHKTAERLESTGGSAAA
ncbi:MAG: hypothetical protein EA352_09165 [Gemmatimonadales bacterium]|nr:MAG: hypothetical protein EA352_09165 [Gemmatimonadales bacterium]